MITKVGLDLGYANITISDYASEIYREPSVALVYKQPRADFKRVIAIGNDAMNRQPVDGEPEGVLIRPFKNGLFYDHNLTEEIICGCIKAIPNAERIRCVVGVPSDIHPKQEKDLFAMLEKAGVESAVSVNRSIAALIGAGFSPNIGVISVNIGAGATEIAVADKWNVIHSSVVPVGGETFDEAVRKYVLDQGDVIISLQVARAIKEKLGAVWKGKENGSIDIEGTLSLTGSRLKMNVTTEDIVGVFEEPIAQLIEAIANAMNAIPADLVEHIFENGIVLTGGGAELFGIEKLLSSVLGLKVVKDPDPINAVARGLSRVNSMISTRLKVNNKNVTAQLGKYYEKSKTQDVRK